MKFANFGNISVNRTKKNCKIKGRKLVGTLFIL